MEKEWFVSKQTTKHARSPSSEPMGSKGVQMRRPPSVTQEVPKCCFEDLQKGRGRLIWGAGPESPEAERPTPE